METPHSHMVHMLCMGRLSVRNKLVSLCSTLAALSGNAEPSAELSHFQWYIYLMWVAACQEETNDLGEHCTWNRSRC